MSRPRVGAWLLAAGGVAVLLALAAAIAVIGTPAEQRRLRLDERRLQHLRQLDTDVRSHHERTGRLPATLDALETGQGDAARAPVDPVSGRPYGYRVLDARRYALCAEFARPSPERVREGRAAFEREWLHDAGRACFTRAAGPEGAAAKVE